MKNKRPAVIFLLVITIALVLLLLVYGALYFFSEIKRPNTSAGVDLYPPDWNADILSEEEYLILDRSISYSDGFGTWHILDGDVYDTKDPVQLFLISYIQDLINGDATNLRAKYSESVIKALKIPTSFTKQRVYESKFTEISKNEINRDGKISFEYEFKIEYKIMKNDGTFRSDLSSDSIKGQYFTILQNDENIQISKVVEYAVSIK